MKILKKNKKVWIASKIVMILAFVALFGLIIMLMWNWLVPEIFGVKPVSYIQALGLLILSKLFFSGFHGKRYSKHGHPSWSKHYRKQGEESAIEEENKL